MPILTHIRRLWTELTGEAAVTRRHAEYVEAIEKTDTVIDTTLIRKKTAQREAAPLRAVGGSGD